MGWPAIGVDVDEDGLAASDTHPAPDRQELGDGAHQGVELLLICICIGIGEDLLDQLVDPIGTPYHPQTCGKVERFHQTLKRSLARQAPARSLAELRLQLDTFRAYYNQHRPHRALGSRTPLVAFHARLKAHPVGATPEAHFRVRHDRVDKVGSVTLRYLSRLRHISVGRAHSGKLVHLLVANRVVRVITDDGSLLRELTLDPSRDYQPRGVPPGPQPRVHDVLRHVSAMS